MIMHTMKTNAWSDAAKKLEDCRREALRAFVVGYLHGRSALGDHAAAGHEAEAAFNKWWTECGSREEVHA